MEIIIIAFILIGAISAFVFRNIIQLSLLRIISFFSVLCLCLSIAGFVMLEYKMPLPFTVWYFALNIAFVDTLSNHITFYGCLLVKEKINISYTIYGSHAPTLTSPLLR